MKTVLVVTALIVHVYCASLPEDAQATVDEYENTNDGTGNYAFRFLTSNGIERRESGKLVNVGQPDEHIEVEGEVSYNALDGTLVTIHYTAGKNGYQVKMDSYKAVISNRLSPNIVASLLG